MKLYNAIATFDVYVVAETPEAARETLIAAINDQFKPSEMVSYEVTRENAIRSAWRDERPFIDDDVSDEDFAKLKGKTTAEAFTALYTR